MYIARDSVGTLHLYESKPRKGSESWLEAPQESYGAWILPEDWYPEVRWEDEEPKELVLKPIEE